MKQDNAYDEFFKHLWEKKLFSRSPNASPLYHAGEIEQFKMIFDKFSEEEKGSFVSKYFLTTSESTRFAMVIKIVRGLK